MSQLDPNPLQISRATRLLFFAPHPDDESLAAGGLLQNAVIAGAQVRVVFVTSGDNNPWPLRALERQWRVTAADRLLWAMRRMEEAREALRALGLPREAAHFLHQPDQKLTELYLRQEREIAAQMREAIDDFQPTLLFVPAPFDTHPDHSAVYLLVRQALRAARPEGLAFFSYVIHQRRRNLAPPDLILPLSADEQATKRRAVLCHHSQMALSRRRFLRHVRAEEFFWNAAPPLVLDPQDPIRSGQVAGGFLRLSVRMASRTGNFARCRLYIAADGGADLGTRWLVQLPWSSARVAVREAASGRAIARAQVRIAGRRAMISLPAPDAADWRQLFVKLAEPSVFYDRTGWRELPLNCAAHPATNAGRAILSAQPAG